MRTGMKMPQQKPSVLLSQDENDQIFLLLGHRCQTLATTVVELYTTGGCGGGGGRNNGVWQMKEMGVLCLVKDNTRRSYFFRLYCPVRKALLWEHEVYNNMEYLAPAPFLHTFEAEDCIMGFNFANENEGSMLREVLLDKLESKRQKRLERKSRNVNSMSISPQRQQNGVVMGGGAVMGGVPIIGGATPLGGMPLPAKPSPASSSSKKEPKKRLTKADIGKPLNFRHVSHVGWTPDRGFDLDNVEDPQLKEFFAKAGVSESQLQDRETREFIYDFILRNGGMEAVNRELEPAPPIPQRGKAPPPPPSRTPPTLPPPPPPPPPPPLRLLPPRNPPGVSAGGGIASPMSSAVRSTATSSTSGRMASTVDGSTGGVVPPPPPPPPMSPPPPALITQQIPDSPRSALLNEIRNGKSLRPVNVNGDGCLVKKQPNSRGELLDQIKVGVELKPVNQGGGGRGASPERGLAGALARALAERSKVIHSDSSSASSQDEEEEDDDEWED